eukprot:CAMPEP_0183575082 /NCGR_PEP_ID=MMETSP0371-20130417/134761_1 /TAXON_ID=268820 /ORGANISM="Peridinium aciculiferum, Strain PAER-2" /LENGTH=83 /DNA_ID=CAMNT_0025785207 /DNA_START=1 /DNA_END=249 /DNA_ORIENTATION=+
MVMAGWDHDQPSINAAYEGQIATLDPVFNVHGPAVSSGNATAEDAVIVHFTGQVPSKGMFADADHLRSMRFGGGADASYGLVG